jgi:DNA mismatch repair protein MSH5
LHRLHVSNTLGDWSHLLSFANSALKIINAIEQFNHDFFDPLKNPEWIQALETVRNDIARHIDFEESKKENRIVVNQHIDHDLDEIKRVYHGLNDFLGQLADRIVLPPNTATEFSLVYFPQLGFLIAIQFPPETQNYELAELSFQFSAEGSGYYKNKDMTDLDLEIGDIHSNICDRELEIIQRLRERVVEFQCLSSIASLLFELDVYLGLSEVAVCNRYVKPTMTDTDEFKLEMSRHPIMELVLDHFVPNTISFQQKAMAITGPNASGKSVLMQQVLLFY